jgi:LPS sulfotransferase NodH
VARLINYKLFSAFGGTDFVPFIVLTRSRTGSNMLISMLDSHPNIRAEGELFRDLNPKLSGFALDLVFSRQPRHVRASGFKIFYGHARKGGATSVWDKLERMDRLSVIHLKRKNILRTVVSDRIARDQGVWLAKSSKDLPKRCKRIKLPIAEAERAFSLTKLRELEGDRRFGAHRRLELYYEDLVSDAQATFQKVTEFLNVPYVEPTIQLRKQNPEPLKDLLVNYDELKAAFSETHWQQCFDD